MRVELKTDERNLASREAIVPIGATLEGILRCYQTRPDGFVRNTALYSLIAGDWPGIRAALEASIAQGGGTRAG